MGWVPLNDKPAAQPSATSALDIDRIAGEEGVDPILVRAVMGAESSGGKDTRVSVDGARGPMQMMQKTFAGFADKGWDINNPEHNVRAGARYLKRLSDKVGGDPFKIGAAYLSGEGNVDKWGIINDDVRDGNKTRPSQHGAKIAAAYKQLRGEDVVVPPSGFMPPAREKTKEADEIGVVGATGKGLAKGMIGLAETVNIGGQFIANRFGSDDAATFFKSGAEFWSALGKKYDPPPELQGNILDKPELLGKGSWWAYNVMNMVPSVASTVVPAMGTYKLLAAGPAAIARLARVGAAITGGTIGGSQEGLQTYKEVLDRGGSEGEAAMAGTLMALASAGLNALSVDRMLGKSTSLLKKFILSGSTEALTEWLEEPAEGAILGQTSVAKPEDDPVLRAREGVNVIPPSFLMGGGTGAVSGRRDPEQKAAGNVPPGTNPPGATPPGTPPPAPGAGPTPSPNGPAAPVRTATPDELTAIAQRRLDELDKIASGTPGATITGPDGKPVNVPPTQPALLDDAEKAERDYLRKNIADPLALSKVFGVKLATAPQGAPVQDGNLPSNVNEILDGATPETGQGSEIVAPNVLVTGKVPEDVHAPAVPLDVPPTPEQSLPGGIGLWPAPQGVRSNRAARYGAESPLTGEPIAPLMDSLPPRDPPPPPPAPPAAFRAPDGMQYRVVPITEENFQQYMRPGLSAGSPTTWRDYSAKYPAITHMRLKSDDGANWRATGGPFIGSEERLMQAIPAGSQPVGDGGNGPAANPAGAATGGTPAAGWNTSPSESQQPAPTPTNARDLSVAPSSGTPSPKAPKLRAAAPLNPDRDDLLTAIAKLGGLDWEQARSTWGLDPADWKKAPRPVFGKPVFRKNDGRMLDDMAEALHEAGYLEEATPNALFDALDRHVGGNPVYTARGYENQAERLAAEARGEPPQDQDEEGAPVVTGEEADAMMDALEPLDTPETGPEDAAIEMHGAQEILDHYRERYGDAVIEDIIERASTETEGGTQADYEAAVIRLIGEYANGNEYPGQQPAQGAGGTNGAADEGGAARAGAVPGEGGPPGVPEGEVTDQTPAPAGVSVSGAGDFALDGQTNAEIKADEAAKAQAEKDARARDNAPPPGDFLLTGSDRQADRAAAMGQDELFGAQPPSSEKAKALKDAEDALGDLADIFGKNFRANITPEQEQKLLPVLTRLFDAAFRAGYYSFKDAAKWVMQQIRTRIGDEVGDQIDSEHLQGAYIGMSGKHKATGNVTPAAQVVSIEKADVDAAAAKPEKSGGLSAQEAKAVAEFRAALRSDEGIPTIVRARSIFEQSTGTKPDGVALKRVDELVELAVVLEARDIAQSGQPAQGKYDALVALYRKQPTLGTRTSTSIENQAYSTPAPLAFLSNVLLGKNQGVGKTLEPTAGNGMLVMTTPVERAVVNELNDDRANALREQGFTVTQDDASKAKFPKVRRVVANPPFGVVRDEAGQPTPFSVTVGGATFSTNEIDHAITFNSLDAMEDDGTAVFIVGGVAKTAASEEARSDAYNGNAKRTFYFHLYENYNVVDHFTVSGALYAKQGAAWPVDVIVIRGRGKSSLKLPAVDVPRVYNSWDELRPLLDKDYGEGTGVGARTQPDADRGGRGAGAAGDQTRPADVPQPAGRSGAGTGDGGRRPAGGGSAAGAGAGIGGPVVGSGQRDSGDGRIGAGGEQSTTVGATRDPAGNGPASEPATGGKPGGESATGNGPADSGGKTGVVGKRSEPTPVEGQAPYTPTSKSNAIGTLVPTNMQTAVRDALAALEASVGNIDEFVAKELGYDPKKIGDYFSAEQIDALGLALQQIKAGRGFIIGDQTGIGKGRVVAGVIRYALRNGLTPIFVTEKPNLYADMYRDLTDIGVPEIRPVMTNGGESIPLDDTGNAFLKSPASGRHNDDLSKMAAEASLGNYNMIFTTYSQMQTLKGAYTQRMLFLEAFASNGVVIFDESHNAGGNDVQSRSKKEDEEGKKAGRAAFARALAGLAKGVFYSSATYAKRPSVMDLYFKTDMALAVDGNVAKLPEAIQAGGVPLQQVVASMLTTAGQYIRRERSFAGVEYNTTPVPVDRKAAEKISAIMLGVKMFDDLKTDAVKELKKQAKASAAAILLDGATGEAGAQSTNFTSIMHNLIDQMLLALKIESAAELAIEALRRGEKPVITVANTMGSFIEEYTREVGLVSGDAIGLTFKDLMLRYLERSRMVTVKDVAGRGSRRRLTDEELGPRTVAHFKSVKKMIEGADNIASVPVSPIDWLHFRLKEAGFTSGEITGRNHTIEYSAKGAVYRTRSTKDTSIAGRRRVISGFNGGTLDAVILNQAGSTGLSLHASEKFKDQRRRRMVIAQAERNIDTHMQMLGRVHRTGQVIAPAYDQLVADIPAEKRPAAVLAKKMASLNANTTASRSSQFTAKETVDFLNDYGDEVVAQLMMDSPDIHRKLGEPLARDNEGLAKEDAARKVTGRIPMLPVKEQEELYDMIESGYKDRVQQAEAMGENALEAKTLELDAKERARVTLFEGAGGESSSPFSAGADMVTFDVKRIGKPYTSAQVRSMVATRVGGSAEADLVSLARLGATAWRAEVERVTGEEFQTFQTAIMKEAAEEGGSDKVIEGRMHMIATQRERWLDVARSIHPGGSYSIQTEDGTTYYAVVSNIARKKGVRNPVAPGSWTATFLLADGARAIALPFSKLASDKYHVAPRQSDALGTPILKLFDDGQTQSREKRVIVTGNLLAGYSKAGRGQVVNFTTSDGRVEQGILMPRAFDLEAFSKIQPVTLTPDMVPRFFQKASGGIVRTADGLAEIRYTGGDYVISVPKSKAEGGAYFLHQGLRGVAGEFTSRGNTMRATLDSEAQLVRALNVIVGPIGQKLQVTTYRDEAKAVGGTSVGGEGASVAREPAKEYSDKYETDLFGNPIPSQRGSSRSTARGQSAVAPGDVESAGAVLDIPAGKYATRAALVTTRQQQLGAKVVRTLEDAANALAYLRSSAVERLDAIVTDSAGKPLAVIGGFKGALTQASVYPSTMLGEAIMVPGARHIWMVHNHPSGTVKLSTADEALAKNVARVFGGTQIRVAGIVAVSRGKWGGGIASEDFAGDRSGALSPVDGPTVPAQERQITEGGELGAAITGPQSAKRLVKDIVQSNMGRPTIILLSAQNDPIAAIPWAPEDAMPLRDNGKIDALLRAVATANASAAIIGTGGTGLTNGPVMSMAQAKNIGAGLAKMDVSVLDIIDQSGASVAESMGGVTVPSHMFSRAPGAATSMLPKDVEAAIAPVRRVGRGLPPVVTVQSVDQLPKDLQDAIEEDGSVVRGAYHNGTIYMIGDNLTDPADAEFTVLHEALHFGLEGVFGRELNPVLMKIHEDNAKIRAEVAKLRALHPQLSIVKATEEVLADMAGRGESPTVMQKFIGWIRDWFRRRGINLKMSDADVMAIIGRAQGHWKRPAKWTHLYGTSFSERAPVFYSQLAAVIGAKGSTAMGQEWAQRLAAWVKAGAVKADEVEWSGVNEWLAMQQGKVTTESVLDYLRQNGVKVEEVTLGGGEVNDGAVAALKYYLIDHAGLDQFVAGDLAARAARRDARAIGDIEGLIDNASDYDRLLGAFHSMPPAKYASYQLPGGTNYREVLLTLPLVTTRYEVEASGDDFLVWRVHADGQRDVFAVKYDRAKADDLANTLTADARKSGEGRGMFQSGHWEQPNVLAHIRLNDRADREGRRVLFVEEVQSDYGQQGRKRGFKNSRLKAELDAKYNRGEKLTPDEIDAYNKQVNDALPAAPFVQKTDAWVALAIKRVIRMAAEEGYDAVAFVTGEQAADRFGLSNYVDRIVYEKTDEGLYELIAYKRGSLDDYPGSEALHEKEIDLARIEALVGKEIAQKISDEAGERMGGAYRGWRELKGVDLEVGGDGMKTFYGDADGGAYGMTSKDGKPVVPIVQKVAKDVLKKVGGGAMGAIDMRTSPQPENRDALQFHIDHPEFFSADTRRLAVQELAGVHSMQPGFLITDAMRASAMQGLPLFARKGGGGTIEVDGVVRSRTNSDGKPIAQDDESLHNFWRWFGDSRVVDEQGRPLVVYHGGQKLTAWNKKGDDSQVYGGHAEAVKREYGSMLSEVEIQDLDWPAHFFSDDRYVAEGYGDQGKDYEVREQYIRGDRLLDLRIDVVGEKAVEIAMRSILGEDYELSEVGYGQFREISRDLRWSWSSVRKKVEAQGYDGIVLYDTDVLDRGKHTSYAVFDPAQIKSATGNRGTFDPENPDIRLSRRDQSQITPDNAPPTEGRFASGYAAQARKAINWIDAKLDPIGMLPGKREYLTKRYATLGRIAKLEEVSKELRRIFGGASDENQQAAYKFFLTPDADPEAIPDQAVRAAAVRAKSLIESVGEIEAEGNGEGNGEAAGEAAGEE